MEEILQPKPTRVLPTKSNKRDRHHFFLILFVKMNASTQQLLVNSVHCYNYLGESNRGAIQLQMRNMTRYCLDGMRQTIQFLTNLSVTLDQQLARANAAIAQRDTTIQNLRAQRVEDVDALAAIAAADAAAQQILEDERQKLTKDHEEMLNEILKKHEQELKDAQIALASAKEAKKNSNKILTLLLAFCKKQDDAVVGFMYRNGIEHFDIGVLDNLFKAMMNDENIEFHDDDAIMGLINALSNTVLGPERLITNDESNA